MPAAGIEQGACEGQAPPGPPATVPNRTPLAAAAGLLPPPQPASNGSNASNDSRLIGTNRRYEEGRPEAALFSTFVGLLVVAQVHLPDALRVRRRVQDARAVMPGGARRRAVRGL